MGKAKLFGTIGKMALGAVAPDLLEQGTRIVNDQLEKRKDYIKVPDVKFLPKHEAVAVMEKYQFNHSVVKINPDTKYINNSPDTIVKIEPKGNTLVDPNTFIKLYYIDEQTLQASQKLAQDLEYKKILKKQKAQAQLTSVIDNTSKIPSNLSKKIHMKKEEKTEE